MINTEITAQILIQTAIIKGHFRLAAGSHSDSYVKKQRIFSRPADMAFLGSRIANRFRNREIEVVAGPANGAIALVQWVSYHLNAQGSSSATVTAAYALEVEKGQWVYKGFEGLFPGKSILLVDDSLTTGSSIKGAGDAAVALGGTIIAGAALCNRGGVTAGGLGLKELFCLAEIPLPSWQPEECPLCKEGVPLNEDLGH